MQHPVDEPAGAPREKILNAPFLPVLIAASMPVLFWFQERLPDEGLSMAFRAGDLAHGLWSGLFTSMLLHGNWAHVTMNAVGALAFGAPVARLLARGFAPLAFIALYVCSGVVAAWGYALCHPGSMAPLEGASGAVFGLIGAATRLLGGHGRVLPLFHPAVLKAAAVWMGVNLLIGLVGFAPGAEGARIAWEAHAFGFLFGILAIGPLGRWFAPR
ncbi:rhomboid family intramembrane serine protease [Brevundimonas sp. P7753]|uniref:rhomboid family intramembrane serine protease n=1 Tax=Brevundimonas sp. P7753 TaxID=2726982 RepID=UPI0015C0332C|nr:rhomboid family intramembrane serine protease [Brevundimonas sp. P7753]NWE53497.1 rhomboid family intramembrane serine protease [Brevundimonas sp. P7753]